MIDSVYYLLPSGIPILSVPINEQFENALNDDTDLLFSGMIHAISNFMNEIAVGEARAFQTDKFNIFISTKSSFTLVVIAGLDTKTKENELEELAKELVSQIAPYLLDVNLSLFSGELPFADELTSKVRKSIKKWESENQNSAASKLKKSLW